MDSLPDSFNQGKQRKYLSKILFQKLSLNVDILLSPKDLSGTAICYIYIPLLN